MKKHRAYWQPASTFPDWGYLCGTPAGEASHWPPFVKAYVEYLHANYTPGTDGYDKLVAFLIGVESHIEADVVWHWGRRTPTTQPQGYLESMSHDASDCRDDWNSGSQKPNCHSDETQELISTMAAKEATHTWLKNG